MFGRDSLSKKSHWNMIFLVSSGKMIFLFTKNMIIFFRRKIKDDISQKYMEIWYFLQMIWKRWSFQKNHTGTWSFLYHQERWHSFSRKFFLWTEIERWFLLKNAWKYDVFHIFGKGGTSFSYKHEITPLSKK